MGAVALDPRLGYAALEDAFRRMAFKGKFAGISRADLLTVAERFGILIILGQSVHYQVNISKKEST